MNNSYLVAVRPEIAAKLGLSTLSDLARVSRQSSIGITVEFAERPDGLPGLATTYGIQFASFRSFATMRLRYEAMLQGRHDVISAFGTDWQINAWQLVTLKDDKGVFPPYELAPVVRRTVFEQVHAVAALNRVSEALNTDKMRALNEEVERYGREPRVVAAEFLRNVAIVR